MKNNTSDEVSRAALMIYSRMHKKEIFQNRRLIRIKPKAKTTTKGTRPHALGQRCGPAQKLLHIVYLRTCLQSFSVLSKKIIDLLTGYLRVDSIKKKYKNEKKTQRNRQAISHWRIMFILLFVLKFVISIVKQRCHSGVFLQNRKRKYIFRKIFKWFNLYLNSS